MKKWEKRELCEFIKFAKEICQKFDDEDSIQNQYIIKSNLNKKEYFKTEKGIFAKRLGDYKRRSRMNLAGIAWHEKILIGEFYKNCPEGYEVDHIIPVSKGGKHRLSNLQYLTRSDNRRKHAKLDWKKE